MAYDILVISAHPDDAEVQMGGTLAALADQGQRALLVDLCDGEPSDFAAPGVRAEQARRAAAHLGVDRLFLGAQDRFITDTPELRLAAHKLYGNISHGSSSPPLMRVFIPTMRRSAAW